MASAGPCEISMRSQQTRTPEHNICEEKPVAIMFVSKRIVCFKANQLSSNSMGNPGNFAGTIHHKSEHTQIILKKTFPNPKGLHQEIRFVSNCTCSRSPDPVAGHLGGAV